MEDRSERKSTFYHIYEYVCIFEKNNVFNYLSIKTTRNILNRWNYTKMSTVSLICRSLNSFYPFIILISIIKFSSSGKLLFKEWLH